MGRNKYTFSALSHQELPAGKSGEEVYALAEALLYGTDGRQVGDLSSFCEQQLKENAGYYVLHDYVVYKGKSKYFRGSCVISGKQDLIAFMIRSLAVDDLRPMLILAVKDPQWVIRIDDECSGYLHVNSLKEPQQ